MVKLADGSEVPAAELSHIKPEYRTMAVRMDSLKRDPNNLRRHDDGGIENKAASLRRFGQVKPIHYHAESRVLLDGNGRHEAIERHLGWTYVAAVPIDLPWEEAVALALVLNKTGDDSSFDFERVQQKVREWQKKKFDLTGVLSKVDVKGILERSREAADTVLSRTQSIEPQPAPEPAPAKPPAKRGVPSDDHPFGKVLFMPKTQEEFDRLCDFGSDNSMDYKAIPALPKV